MTKTGTDSYCPLCDLLVATFLLPRHQNGERCNARVAARRLRKRGLIPYEPPRLLNVISKHVDEALALFDLPHEIHPTRAAREPTFRGSGKGDQAWTTEAGVEMMDVVLAVAKLLTLSFPEAARRLHERRELIPRFDTARRLDAPEDVLRGILAPIDYVIGSDGKRRPYVPMKLVRGGFA